MKHRNSARDLANTRGLFTFLISSLLFFANATVTTQPNAAASYRETSFTDPSAVVLCGSPNFRSCTFGQDVYIGPFATIKAGPRSTDSSPSIIIGNSSNVQDNALLDNTSSQQPITLGEKVIIAHGAHVLGGARIGMTGTCNGVPGVCPSFVGFNSEVAQTAVVERDAMVGHLARVGPGITIHSGLVVLPGKNITSAQQIPSKTRPISQSDRNFMNSVIHVNEQLAAGYIELQEHDPSSVRGINYNPVTDLVRDSVLPIINGRQVPVPESPTRIIGNVQIPRVNLASVGRNVSLRADEGTPFTVGEITSLQDSATFHALEHSRMTIASGSFGAGSLMHGGPFNNANTTTGRNFVLGNNSVFFNSTAGDNCRIGSMSFVTDTALGNNRTVGDRIVLEAGVESQVEWIRGTPTLKRGKRGKRGH